MERIPQEHFDFFMSIRHWYIQYTLSKVMKDASVLNPPRLQSAMRGSFEPNYVACLTCPSSIQELFERAFFHFENYLNALAQEESSNIEAEESVHVLESVEQPIEQPRQKRKYTRRK
jgi:hypothetical protein